MRKLDPAVKKMTLKQKQDLLRGEISLVNKKFGREVVSFGYNKGQNRVPFKNVKMNSITGGGAACGKFNVYWGAKSSGKTTLCYENVAMAQAEGKSCIWVDFERSFSKTWAETQGVNVDDLIVCPAFQDAESALDTVISLVKTKAVDVVVIDSIQGMSPIGEQETKKGVEKSMADETMALLARKLSQFFRKSSFGIWESDCSFILVGQTRMDLGGFIALEKLTGGTALEHWSCQTIHLRRTAKALWPFIMVDPNEVVGENDEIEEIEESGKKSKKIKRYTGYAATAKIDKSKVGPDEGKEANLIFEYGKGFKN